VQLEEAPAPADASAPPSDAQPPAEQPVPQSGTSAIAAPAPSTPAVATPAAPATPAQASGAVSTAYAIEELRAIVQLASARGAAHARIQLRPAELGGLVIRLRSTSEGMIATIKAERPEAVAALDGAAADLRRSLEDRGVTLVRLDVGLAPGAGDGAATGRRQDTAHNDSAANASSSGTTATDGADLTDDEQISAPTVRLPAGSLVDVHA
jgi:flagellar hook-length control protein FliK